MNAQTDTLAEGNDLLSSFVDVFRELPQKQQVILSLYYFQGMEQRHVAETMGITSSQVSHEHTAAVMYIRSRMIDYFSVIPPSSSGYYICNRSLPNAE